MPARVPKSILLLLVLSLLPVVASAAQQPLAETKFCFEGKCFPTLSQAEAELRSKAGTYGPLWTKARVSRYMDSVLMHQYVVKDQEAETMYKPGYRASGNGVEKSTARHRWIHMIVRERKFSSLLGGATTHDWNISARCVCDGASFSLDEFQVDLTPVVYLRRLDQYSSPGHAMEVRLKELDHVGDINAWSAGEKASAESYERFLRLQAYQSQAECESNNRDAMESFVRTGFYPAMMGSIYRWDSSRKHDVTEW